MNQKIGRLDTYLKKTGMMNCFLMGYKMKYTIHKTTTTKCDNIITANNSGDIVFYKISGKWMTTEDVERIYPHIWYSCINLVIPSTITIDEIIVLIKNDISKNELFLELL